MLLRVLVDVGDNVPKLAVRRDGNAPEGMLKQAARSVIRFVDGFGVGVEEVGEFLGCVILWNRDRP